MTRRTASDDQIWLDDLLEESFVVAPDAMSVKFGRVGIWSRDVLAEVMKHECRDESESESEDKNHGCVHGARLSQVLEQVVECYCDC